MTLSGKQIIDTLMIKHQYQVVSTVEDLNTICMTLLQDMVAADLSDVLVIFDSEDKMIEVSFLDEETGVEHAYEYPIDLSDDFKVSAEDFGGEFPDA